MIPTKGVTYRQLYSARGMSYDAVMKKLKQGISLFDRDKAASSQEIDALAQKNATKYNRKEFRKEFSGLGEGFMEKIQSGNILPDELFGWSTKSILALLLIAMVVKLKKGI